MTDRFSLEGRTALITGASRGIAAAIARGIAEQGAAVAINYSAQVDTAFGTPDAARKLVREITAGGGTAVTAEGDLSDKSVPRRIVDEVTEKLGALDILILSASVQINKPFLEMTESDIEAHLEVNITAGHKFMQFVLPAMLERGWGRIVTIGSVNEASPHSIMAIYAATKAAQTNLVQNLALQTAPHGITVNNIAPGLVKTDRNLDMRLEGEENWRAQARRATPMGRAGLPEDIVGAAIYLCSDAASFVTGATIHVTGGAHIPRPLDWSTEF